MSRRSIYSLIFTESSLIKALSAVVGSFVSSSIFYPLNVARLKLQCDPDLINALNNDSSSQFTFVKVIYDMIKKQGFLSLYQGWTANSISLCIGSFIYFYLNNAFRLLYQRRRGGMDNQDLSYTAHILVASISGIVNILITTPLWVATTRLTMQDRQQEKEQQLIMSSTTRRRTDLASINPQIPSVETEEKEIHHVKKTLKRDLVIIPPTIKRTRSGSYVYQRSNKTYNGLFHCLYEIYNEGGVKALWAGLVPSLFLVSNPAIQTVTYEKLLIWYENFKARTCNPFEFFLLAAFAKAVATIFTYPLQVAQSQLQNHSGGNNNNETTISEMGNEGDEHVIVGQSPSLFTILLDIYSEKGTSGLFSGIYAKMWQTVLNSAFMYMTYETVNRFINLVIVSQRRRRRVPFMKR